MLNELQDRNLRPRLDFDPIKLANLKQEHRRLRENGEYLKAFELHVQALQEQFSLSESDALEAACLERTFINQIDISITRPHGNKDYKNLVNAIFQNIENFYAIIKEGSGLQIDTKLATEATYNFYLTQNDNDNYAGAMRANSELVSSIYGLPYYKTTEISRLRAQDFATNSGLGEYYSKLNSLLKTEDKI